jgi:hypothetical protein
MEGFWRLMFSGFQEGRLWPRAEVYVKMRSVRWWRLLIGEECHV